MREHPDYADGVARWLGRQQDDPETPDPEHPGKFSEKMCRRPEEAKKLEDVMLSVERNLCKQGRGEKQVVCPLYDVCGFQRQKQVEARIWLAAHECAVHEMPKAFGDVGWVMFDESPLDAFMFGLDVNKPVELPLDALRTLDGAAELVSARHALHRVLDKLAPPENHHLGTPISKQMLREFVDAWSMVKVLDEETREWRGVCDVGHLRNLELRRKVEPDITPDMPKAQVYAELEKASGNGDVEKCALLWRLVDEVLNGEDEVSGRLQVHRTENGRVIRMVGLRELAKGWDVQTLICDATGDAELLRAIWKL